MIGEGRKRRRLCRGLRLTSVAGVGGREDGAGWRGTHPQGARNPRLRGRRRYCLFTAPADVGVSLDSGEGYTSANREEYLLYPSIPAPFLSEKDRAFYRPLRPRHSSLISGPRTLRFSSSPFLLVHPDISHRVNAVPPRRVASNPTAIENYTGISFTRRTPCIYSHPICTVTPLPISKTIRCFTDRLNFFFFFSTGILFSAVSIHSLLIDSKNCI